MAQHDYVIANGTGAAVRSDLNNALAAIVSQNSGATEPATMYAYQWWADTSTGLLKLRNAANNAWITLRELDGTLTIEAGTVSAPGLAFASDLNTGIYSPSADQLAIATNGVERVEWGTTEVVFNDGGANYDFRIEGDTVDSLFFVDASTDRVGLGTSSASALFHVAQDSSDGTQARITGATNQNYQLRWGFDTTNLVGRIQSIHVGTAYRALALNPDGGNVGIGTTSPGSTLNVVGTTTLYGNGGSAADWGNSSSLARLTYLSSSPIIHSIGASTPLLFGTDLATERMRIDSSGRLLVGTSSSRGSYSGNLEIEATTSAATIAVTQNSANTSPAYLFLAKSRSTSVGGNTIVASGDQLGDISFTGSDGSQPQVAASIRGEVDGTPGANDMPGRLVFSTTSDGATSPTEALRINSSQKAIFAGPTIRCLATYNSTTASAANQFVDSAGDFFRSTSSIKYKTDVEAMEDAYADAILNCRPVWYKSTCNADNPAWGWWGFIAEEVAQIDPRLVHWKTTEQVINEEGEKETVQLDAPEPEGVQYDRFVPHLLNLIKRQGEAIAELQAEVAALKAA